MIIVILTTNHRCHRLICIPMPLESRRVWFLSSLSSWPRARSHCCQYCYINAFWILEDYNFCFHDHRRPDHEPLLPYIEASWIPESIILYDYHPDHELGATVAKAKDAEIYESGRIRGHSLLPPNWSPCIAYHHWSQLRTFRLLLDRCFDHRVFSTFE